MADDDSRSVGVAIGTAVGGASIAFFAGASCWLGMKAYRDGRFSRGWRRVRIWTLGGVTTLGQALTYDCATCGHSLEQREEVRSLSCGHVFHLRKGPKCGSNINDWLRENRMRCPACCKPVHHVCCRGRRRRHRRHRPRPCHCQRSRSRRRRLRIWRLRSGGGWRWSRGYRGGWRWTRGDRGIRRRCGSRTRYRMGRRRSKDV